MGTNLNTAARCCVAGLCITVLMACVGKANTEEESTDYIGWRCDDARLTRGEPCEQVRMVNGRQQALVKSDGEKPAGTKPDGGDKQTIAKTRELILVGDLRPRPWQQQLPGFRVDTSKEPGAPSVDYREQPAPEPEKAFSDVLYTGERNNAAAVESRDASPAQTPEAEQKTETESGGTLARVSLPEPAPEPEPVLEPAPESNTGAGYTVQLGAFASADEAESFLERNNLLHLDITQGHYKRDGRSWYVLSFGVFADRSSAEKAWAAAATNAADLEVWVRRLRR